MDTLDSRPIRNNRKPLTSPERAVPLYRALMLEMERRRRTLGLSMDGLSDLIGVADRYYAKALHADTPSGRVARWQTLQEMMDALFPLGFDVEIKPRTGQRLSSDDLRRKVRFAGAENGSRTQRDLMRELGRRSAQVRAERFTPEQRRAISLKAAATKRAKREQV